MSKFEYFYRSDDRGMSSDLCWCLNVCSFFLSFHKWCPSYSHYYSLWSIDRECSCLPVGRWESPPTDARHPAGCCCHGFSGPSGSMLMHLISLPHPDWQDDRIQVSNRTRCLCFSFLKHLWSQKVLPDGATAPVKTDAQQVKISIKLWIVWECSWIKCLHMFLSQQLGVYPHQSPSMWGC